MTRWSNENPSCVMTWITLALLDQSTKAFPRSGGIKLRRLAFWSGSASARAARARALAIQIDGVFRELGKAKYEQGTTKRTAIGGMRAQLLRGDDTVADFAETNDGLYKFLRE